jgi:hypothetical protein
MTQSVLKKCTYNIIKIINDNDSGDATPANGDENRKYAPKKMMSMKVFQQRTNRCTKLKEKEKFGGHIEWLFKLFKLFKVKNCLNCSIFLI